MGDGSAGAIEACLTHSGVMMGKAAYVETPATCGRVDLQNRMSFDEFQFLEER
jgi:hypothetical protein